MTIYYIIIFASLLTGVIYEHNHAYRTFIIYTYIFIMLIIFGFRHEVGVDWFSYIRVYERQTTSNIFFDTYEVGYKLLNLIGSWSGLGILFVVFATTFLILFFTIFGAYRFGVNPFYFFAIIAPYHFVISGMNFNRQAIALSIFVYAISLLYENRRMAGLITLLIGSLFHISILSFIFLFFIEVKKKFIPIILIIVCIPMISLMFNEFGHYIDSSMDNSGLYLRALFSAIPSIFILIHFKVYKKSCLLVQRLLILVIMSFPILILISLLSTTLADRFSYYFIILNTMVWFKINSQLSKKIKYFNTYSFLIFFLASIFSFSIWSAYSFHSEKYFFKSLFFM